MQDQIRPADWLEIVAGLRFDSFKLDVDDLRSGSSDFSRTDKLWSPRLGLILKPLRQSVALRQLSAAPTCRSRATSSAASTSTTRALKPERFDNYEIGAKWEPIDGLLATAAIYQLDRTNTRAPGRRPGPIVLTGASAAAGIELGLERSITSRWQISAGYALQKAEITETTAAAPAGRERPAGAAPQLLAVEPLRLQRAARRRPRRHRPLEVLRVDQQCR